MLHPFVENSMDAILNQLTECTTGLQGPNGSTGRCRLGSRHELAVGTDLAGGGLATRGAGVERSLIFFRHARCRRSFLALLF